MIRMRKVMMSMRSSDVISMALRNLWKRKLRTFLTVLGVIIGTASIVVMISIGIGMNESYMAQAEQWGSLQVINVSAPYSYDGMMVSTSSSGSSSSNGKVVIDAKAIETFKKIEGVETATPVISEYMPIICGKYMNDVQFKGIDPAAMEALGYHVQEGRLLEEGDSFKVVVGMDVQNNFYNPRLNWRMRYSTEPPEVDLMNEKVQITYDYNYGTNYADKKIKPYKVEVVGILESGGNDSYSVIMPLKDLEKIKKDKENYERSASGNNSSTQRKQSGTYEQAMVKVYDMNDVQDIQDQIKEMGYEAYSSSDYLEQMKETSKMLRMMLGAIGAVSLFVAAIGITNTMVMSIYERTKEIGVMKVIGASLKDIKRLFLTEAAFIGFVGGIFGIVLSLVASKVVNYFATMQQSDMLSSIPIWLCLAALAFATFVGVAAGYLPAKRAMKLSALTAIRTE